MYSPFGGSVILEKLGTTLDHSVLLRTKDLLKFKIVKTNFKFEVIPLSAKGLRNKSFFWSSVFS